MFYLTMHSTHFIYGYMASDIWLRTILIVRKETRCCHIDYSYRLTAKDLLYAPSHRQDNTYHSLCYTSRGALDGSRNSSMGPLHEGSIRRPSELRPAPFGIKRNWILKPEVQCCCMTRCVLVQRTEDSIKFLLEKQLEEQRRQQHHGNLIRQQTSLTMSSSDIDDMNSTHIS